MLVTLGPPHRIENREDENTSFRLSFPVSPSHPEPINQDRCGGGSAESGPEGDDDANSSGGIFLHGKKNKKKKRPHLCSCVCVNPNE